MSTFLTSAIPLRIQPMPRDSAMAIMFTKDKGKIVGYVRSGKKIKGKLLAPFNTFSELEVMIAPGRQFDIVAGVKQQWCYKNAQAEYAKRILLLAVLDATTRLTVEHEYDYGLYEFLRGLMKYVDAHEIKNVESWYVLLVWKIVDMLGFAPQGSAVSDISTELKAILSEVQELPYTEDFFSFIANKINHGIDSKSMLEILEQLTEFELMRFPRYTITT